NEIAEVVDEADLVLRPSALILVYHPPEGVERAFVDVLAADKSEIDRPCVVVERRRDRTPDAAPVPVSVNEAVPIDVPRLQPADQHPRRPVRFRRHRRARPRDHAPERLVLGDFDGEQLASALVERPAGPEDDAVRIEIARRHALRIGTAGLAPAAARSARLAAPRQRRAHRRRNLDEIAAAERHRTTLWSISPNASANARP